MRLATFFSGTSARTGFLKREGGAVTVEAVLWLPMFFAAVMLTVDVAMIFNGQTLAYKTVQDANRKASTGWFNSTGEVESFVNGNIASFAPNAVSSSAVSGGVVTTSVQIPATDLIITGWFDALAGFNVTVTGSHVMEF